MTADDVRTLLRAAVAETGTIRQWADDHNVCKSLVSLVLTGRRLPPYYILRALGLRKVVSYEVDK